MTTARQLGLTVSCDCNYRSKLWSMEDAGRQLTALMPHVNVVLCGKDDPQKLFGLEPEICRQRPVREEDRPNSCGGISISMPWG